MILQFCTIVARNYLPQARCLAESLAKHHADMRLSVLVVDGEFGGYDPGSEPFDCLLVNALDGDQADLHRMAALYDVLEYSTSLKPWLLKTVLERGAESVVYLDPDIQVYAPLGELFSYAGLHELVLTPHATAPMSRDGRQVSEATILSSGVYNLGCIGVGQRSRAFLEFWMDRLKRDCLIDHQNMLFTDQRWIDFAPGMFDAAILKEPTYNVAYWNLDQRSLSFVDGQYLVNGRPLRFFHFSGYKPKYRHLLSTHQGEKPRILLSEQPVLRGLCDDFGTALEQHGYAPDLLPSYGFARTAGGLEIDRFIRSAYRAAVIEADKTGEGYPPDPWDVRGDEDFVRWLNSPAVFANKTGRLSRYLRAVVAGRPDVQSRFPDYEGVDYPRLMYWARHQVRLGSMSGRLGFGTPGAVRRADGERDEAEAAQQWPSPDQLQPGFSVVGYFKAELGIGQSARLVVASLAAAGLPYETFDNDLTSSRQDFPFEVTSAFTGSKDINLVVANADQLPHFRARVNPDFFTGRHTIGQWAWELEEFPEQWSPAFELVDEIWGISEFTARSIARYTDKPVFAAPLAIIAPDVPGDIGRAELGLPEKVYIFLFCFDLLSDIERKNPLGLLDAFKRAFLPDSGALLVVKAINGDIRPNELERLKYVADGRRDIVVIDHYLDSDKQAALMNVADCYVSLHRSEGFGLTMAEAMALGKPVIATGYSANLEFMDPQTAYLVNWSTGFVPRGCDPYPEGSMWAEPDLDHAADRMRYLFQHPDEGRTTGERARRSVEENYGPAARAAFYVERFDAIQKKRADLVERAAATVASSPPAIANRHGARERARKTLARWPAASTAYFNWRGRTKPRTASRVARTAAQDS